MDNHNPHQSPTRRAPEPGSIGYKSPARRAAERKQKRVTGIWRLDLKHPDGSTTTGKVEAVWISGHAWRYEQRLRASVYDESMKIDWTATTEPCSCCDRPTVIGYRIGRTTDPDLRGTLTAETRRLLGELVFRIAEEAGLLADPDGEAKATQP